MNKIGSKCPRCRAINRKVANLVEEVETIIANLPFGAKFTGTLTIERIEPCSCLYRDPRKAPRGYKWHGAVEWGCLERRICHGFGYSLKGVQQALSTFEKGNNP